MKILVDAMGGDNAPEQIILGSVDAIRDFNLNIIFCGKKNIIEENLISCKDVLNRVDIIDAEEIITNEDKPVNAVRRKKKSSLVMGMTALNSGEADAFVSAGNTGAILSGGVFITGRIPGIERPALAPLFPNGDRCSVMLDVGANVDCKPVFLYQFAKMGTVYMEEVIGVQNPSVGLINIGIEEEKGNKLVRETYKMLENSNLNFTGNVEARDIIKSNTDVLVCDGFVGNMLLKATEGVMIELMNGLKNTVAETLTGRIGGFLIRNQVRKLRSRYDYSEHGGAPLLGVEKAVIKAHGSSDRKAFKNAVKQAKIFVEKDVIGKIKEKIDEE